MTKKLSKLFFSTIKRAARMQRQAFKLAGAPVAKKTGKSTKRKTAKRAAMRVPRPPAEAMVQPSGKGIWQNLSHDIPPTSTELLGRLAYSLYRPTGMPLAGLPLVVMLHGCQQTPGEMAQGTRMNQLADQKGFVVAYPQQARRVQQMRCWQWFKPDAGHGLAEADRIAGLARTLARRHRLDASRIYIAGLSAGAGMAALTVLRHPGVFAAAALHSGAVVGAARDAAGGLRVMRRGVAGDAAKLMVPLLDDGQSFPGMPAMILHGMRDGVVSVRNALQLTQQFSGLNGVSAAGETVLGKGTHREYVRRDFRQSGRAVVRLCLFKDVGHAWSGGNGKLRFHSEKGPAASVLIWQFFAMHRKVPSS